MAFENFNIYDPGDVGGDVGQLNDTVGSRPNTNVLGGIQNNDWFKLVAQLQSLSGPQNQPQPGVNMNPFAGGQTQPGAQQAPVTPIPTEMIPLEQPKQQGQTSAGEAMGILSALAFLC